MIAGAPDTPTPTGRTDRERVQNRTVRVLSLVQVFGGIGAAAGAAVGALLAADLATESLSGLSSAASVIGAALVAIPVTSVMDQRGRGPGLILAYAIGVGGALLVVLGAVIDLFPLALVGLVLTGGGTTAGLQSRYAATDLAPAHRRGRALSTVVWSTTIGSVLGPNLASPTGRFAETLGIPRLAGPYLLSVAVYGLCVLLIWLLLRPDPLIVARHELGRDGSGTVAPVIAQRGRLRASLAVVRSSPAAMLGLTAVVTGHAVMVSIMSMTPVHLQHEGATLEIVGLIISAHISGMYVASPLVGIAVDRYGSRQVMVTGGLVLLAACAFAGTAPENAHTQLGIGLVLLGLGWSCTMISGSTLLTSSVPIEVRPRVQGSADLLMGIGGAAAGLLSGVVVGFGSYALLTVIAALVVLGLMTNALRPGTLRPET